MQGCGPTRRRSRSRRRSEYPRADRAMDIHLIPAVVAFVADKGDHLLESIAGFESGVMFPGAGCTYASCGSESRWAMHKSWIGGEEASDSPWHSRAGLGMLLSAQVRFQIDEVQLANDSGYATGTSLYGNKEGDGGGTGRMQGTIARDRVSGVGCGGWARFRWVIDPLGSLTRSVPAF